MPVDLIIDPHRVVIENTEVKRPDRVSPSEWLSFWEELVAGEREYQNYWIDKKKKAP